jgi:hypothetical protein
MTNSPNIMNPAVVTSWQPMEESMTAIDRRKLMIGGAVGAAATAATVGLPALAKLSAEGAGQLAALITRYFAEMDAFENRLTDFKDEKADALADATYNKTMSQMVGVPALTVADASAALEWIMRENEQTGIDFDDTDDCSNHTKTAASLVRAVKEYIASTGLTAQQGLGL